MTGSLLVPIKALRAQHALSLTATFGAMVWIFQEGHLSGPARLHGDRGPSTCSRPILMFCIAFGLSMDYEVFLLSRIKEEYDLERDNERAVAVGPAEDGPDRHRGRAPAHDRVRRSRHVGGRAGQGVRCRARDRRARRRIPDPGDARARRSCGWRAGSTGGRRAGCAAGTSGSGSGRTNPIALLDREFETSV